MKRTLEIDRRVERGNASLAIQWLNGEVSLELETGETRPIPQETQRRIKRVFDLVRVVKAFPIRWSEDSNAEVIAELNGILARYPTVFKFQTGMFGGEFRRVPKGASVDVYEVGVVESILEISRDGLDKLQTCRCGRWYLAKKSDQNSCSLACRKARHEQTPEYKARKAAKAKANYKTRKQLPIR